MGHLDQRAIIEFLRGEASEDQAVDRYEHLLTCAPCEEAYLRLKALKEDFDGSWEAFLEEWSAHAGGPILRLVAFVQEDPPLALGELFEEGKGGVWDSIDSPEYVGVASQDSPVTAAPHDAIKQSLDEGDRARVEELLSDWAGKSPQEASFSRKELHKRNQSAAMMIVDAKRKTIAVLVHEPELGSSVRLVTDRGECKECDLVPVPGANYRIAEFEHIKAGWYRVEVLEGE